MAVAIEPPPVQLYVTVKNRVIPRRLGFCHGLLHRGLPVPRSDHQRDVCRVGNGAGEEGRWRYQSMEFATGGVGVLACNGLHLVHPVPCRWTGIGDPENDLQRS
mgnify:CR=1 FL=1